MKRFIVLLALCFLTIVTAAGCFGGSDRFAHTAGPQHTQAAEPAAGLRKPQAPMFRRRQRRLIRSIPRPARLFSRQVRSGHIQVLR